MTLTSTAPFDHQQQVIERSLNSHAFALFMEQGTGKTLVGIATFTHLFLQGKIDGVLILAPNGVHDNWLKREIPKHCLLAQDEQIHMALWRSTMGVKARQRWDYVANGVPANQLAVLGANIEAVRTESFWKAIDKFIKNRRFLLIVDESTAVKNPKAQQTKNCIHLADKASYMRIMTGTPITQSPLDLWSQCRILGKDTLPYTSYTAFKHTFAEEQLMYMGQRAFNKIVGYKNQDLLAKLIEPFSYRVLKKDCLDLPAKVYQTRFVELTSEQKRVYKDLSSQCLAILGDGNGMVTVTTVITMLLRLHQVVLGYVPNDDPKELIPIPHNRINILTELLEENPTKAIIFCRFLQDVHQVTEALPKGSWMTYTGDDNANERNDAVNAFQEKPDCRYFVATSAASKGLTLTAAEQVIYYSQDYRLETRLQSEDRAHRSGQTKTVVYTDLCSSGTVEDAIVSALQAKKQLADGVMDLVAMKKLFDLALD